jgi:acyl-coenzyme A thioesterase 13
MYYPKILVNFFHMKLTQTSFLGGVTRTLNISYLRAIPMGSSLLFSFHPILIFSAYNAGTTIRIHSEVVQAGRTMAMIRGRMTSPDGKTTYCTVEHHKVSVPTQPQHLEHRVEWDGLWEADAVVPGKARL